MFRSLCKPALARTYPRLSRSTTVLCVRGANKVAIMADGQVTMGSVRSKSSGLKLRKISSDGHEVLIGFAGTAVDCLTLFDLLEARIKAHPKLLAKACVDLALTWRKDRSLQRLSATLIVADHLTTLLINGTGELIEPEGFVAGTGSGGNYAVAGARAMLLQNPNADPETVCETAMKVAADMDIYTNTNFVKHQITF
jgi:ATP-dependent HslUV protease subunit HslV